VPKIRYQDKNFQPETLAIIEACDAIVREYQAQGFLLTLRQIYYKFVARDLFPEDRRWRWTGTKWVRDPNGTKNAEPNYKWLGSIVNDGRLAGLLDWSAIEDRTRELEKLSHFESPSDIVEACAEQFHVDLWIDQKYRPEVWIEKDALVGIIEGICNELDVPFFSCRGYTSQSEMWNAAMRLERYKEESKTPVIFHFGDHDPSGQDMTRDIIDRMQMFMGGTRLERLALNMNQIEEHNPPPSPAKLTDSRCRAYVAEFGDDSWELDALEPAVIVGLIRTNIRRLMDRRRFNARLALRDRGRSTLSRVAGELRR
jgi:hypothetical protein